MSILWKWFRMLFVDRPIMREEIERKVRESIIMIGSRQEYRLREGSTFITNELLKDYEAMGINIPPPKGDTMTNLPDKELLRVEEMVFIDRREVNYKRWLPKILRDLLIQYANLKVIP